MAYVERLSVTVVTAADGSATAYTPVAKTVAPRQALHTVAGVAAVYAAAGEPVLGPIGISDSRIKIVLAQGGDTKTGVFHFVIF